MAGRLSIGRGSRKSGRRGCAPGLVIIASTIRRRIKADWARTRGNAASLACPAPNGGRKRIPNRVHFSQRPPQADALVRDMTRGKRLGQMSPAQLRDIAERINQRPMKTHRWRSRNQAAKPL